MLHVSGNHSDSSTRTSKVISAWQTATQRGAPLKILTFFLNNRKVNIISAASPQWKPSLLEPVLGHKSTYKQTASTCAQILISYYSAFLIILFRLLLLPFSSILGSNHIDTNLVEKKAKQTKDVSLKIGPLLINRTSTDWIRTRSFLIETRIGF